MRIHRIPRLFRSQNYSINCFDYCCISTLFSRRRGPCIPRLFRFKNYLSNCFAYCCTLILFSYMREPRSPLLLSFQIYLYNCLPGQRNFLIFVDRTSFAFPTASCLNARATRAARAPNQRRPLVRRREATVQVRCSGLALPRPIDRACNSLFCHACALRSCPCDQNTEASMLPCHFQAIRSLGKTPRECAQELKGLSFYYVRAFEIRPQLFRRK